MHSVERGIEKHVWCEPGRCAPSLLYAAFDRALTFDPGNVRALTNKATSLRALGRNGAAIAAYEQALAADRTAEVTHVTNYNLALLLKQLERYDEALDALDRALEREPSFGLALLEEANVYIALEQYDDALATLDRLVTQEPENGKRMP